MGRQTKGKKTLSIGAAIKIQSHVRRHIAARNVALIRLIYSNVRSSRASLGNAPSPERRSRTARETVVEVIKEVGKAARVCSKVAYVCKYDQNKIHEDLSSELNKALQTEFSWTLLIDFVNHIDFEENMLEACHTYGWDPEIAQKGATYLFHQLAEGNHSKRLYQRNFYPKLAKTTERLKSRRAQDGEIKFACELAERLQSLGDKAWPTCVGRITQKSVKEPDRRFVAKLKAVRATLRLMHGVNAKEELAGLDETISTLENSASEKAVQDTVIEKKVKRFNPQCEEELIADAVASVKKAIQDQYEGIPESEWTSDLSYSFCDMLGVDNDNIAQLAAQNARLSKLLEEMGWNGTEFRETPNPYILLSRINQIQELVALERLDSVVATVRQALAEQNQGAQESTWMPALSSRLSDALQSKVGVDPMLLNMLSTHGWTGTGFQTPPNLNELLEQLEDLAELKMVQYVSKSVKEAKKEQNQGAPDSLTSRINDLLNLKLNVSLMQRLPRLLKVLAMFGWVGSRFQSPPNLDDLGSQLEDLNQMNVLEAAAAAVRQAKLLCQDPKQKQKDAPEACTSAMTCQFRELLDSINDTKVDARRPSLANAMSEFGWTGSEFQPSPNLDDLSSHLEDLTKSKMLQSVSAAVKDAIADQNQGALTSRLGYLLQSKFKHGKLVKVLSAFGWTGTQFEGLPNLNDLNSELEDLTESNMLESVSDAVTDAIAKKDRGASESTWMSFLSSRFRNLVQNKMIDAKLHNILSAFGWTGSQFESPPNLHELSSQLADLTEWKSILKMLQAAAAIVKETIAKQSQGAPESECTSAMACRFRSLLERINNSNVRSKLLNILSTYGWAESHFTTPPNLLHLFSELEDLIQLKILLLASAAVKKATAEQNQGAPESAWTSALSSSLHDFSRSTIGVESLLNMMSAFGWNSVGAQFQAPPKLVDLLSELEDLTELKVVQLALAAVKQAIAERSQGAPESKWTSPLSSRLFDLLQNKTGINVRLVKILSEFGWTTDCFQAAPSLNDLLSQLEDLTRSKMLSSIEAAVEQAIKERKQGTPESTWTSALSSRLCNFLGRNPEVNARLLEVLSEFGWTGVKFESAPDLHQLLSQLEVLATDSTQALNAPLKKPDGTGTSGASQEPPKLDSRKLELGGKMYSSTMQWYANHLTEVSNNLTDMDIQMARIYHNALNRVFASMQPDKVEEVMGILGLRTVWYQCKSEVMSSRRLRKKNISDFKDWVLHGLSGKDFLSWLFPGPSGHPRAGSQHILTKVGMWAQKELLRERKQEKTVSSPKSCRKGPSFHILANPSLPAKKSSGAAHQPMSKRLILENGTLALRRR
eukprot:gnl/MRDRNA2_/MRDRNA2_57349_c0_seq1.p1 gnl/MRDRNA2_/MRDRNA2_57349_c0~~gnl/MRDRNA2_/MRDRNA2_57349_c0_seq1.p1  ORF type:complete len:1334 (+),score=271.81 gnl/MRDRNA2_/MRDRNA2_57349_c0_seq1:1-4002(+)